MNTLSFHSSLVFDFDLVTGMAAPTPGARLAERVRTLSLVSHRVTEAETDEALRIGTSIERYLRGEAEQLVRICADEPVLLCYLADGWSCSLTDRSTSEAARGCTLRWKGEYLLERAVVRCRPGMGDSGLRMIMGPPRLLSKGKSAFNVFTAACDFLPLARTLGHEDICMAVYILDGHMYDSCLRKLRARHLFYYEGGFSDDDADVGRMLQDQDLVFGIKCVAHCLSNAVAWSLKPYNIGETCKDAHIVISSLRKCSKDLHGQLDMWLLQVVRYRGV